MFTRLQDDLRYAARLARRRALLSGAVIAAVALGVGATTAMVTVMDGVLFRALPYPEADRIVWLQGTSERLPRELFGLANPADVADWRERAASFDALAAYSSYTVTLRLPDGPVRVSVSQVSEGMDNVLGIRAAAGRLLHAEDYQRGANAVVLSHELWRTRFAEDPGIVGRSIELNGGAYTVVGVLPASVHPFPHEQVAVWLPLVLSTGATDLQRGGVWLRVVARLRDGVTLEQAAAEMRRVVSDLRAAHERTNAGRGITLQLLRDGIVADVRPMMLLLSGAIAIVLLIACANVGNLLLAGAQEREREFALRRTLGAGGGRLAQLILAETMLLAVLGALAGVLLAPMLVRALVALYPGGLPRATEVGLNLRVLLVAAAATALAAFAAGLPPLRLARRLDLQGTIRAGERGAGTRGERRFRAGLVVAQVALSVGLTIAGGLLLRTFWSLSRTDVGFATDNLITFNVALSGRAYAELEREVAFHEQLIARIAASPGVRSTATTSLMPLATGEFLDAFVREGHADAMPDLPTARLHNVTAGYFETLAQPLRAGRTFDATDRAASRPVAVVNETLAQRYFPEGALGKRIVFRDVAREVVGVVADKRQQGARSVATPDLYLPRAQSDNPRWLAWVVVRTAADPAAVMPGIREALASVDPGVAMDDIVLMTERERQLLAPDRFRAWLVGALAVIALLLAVLGIYGLIAYAVARQQREIGIRMALGETPALTRTRVLHNALRLAGAGALLGVGLALASGQLLQGFVAGVSARDPLTLLVVPALFLFVAAGAALGPAQRAARVDPAVTMRGQ